MDFTLAFLGIEVGSLPGMHVDGHHAEPFIDSPAIAPWPEEGDSTDGAHGPGEGKVPFLRLRVDFKGRSWGILTYVLPKVPLMSSLHFEL